MKKTKGIVLALALILAFTACSKPSSNEKEAAEKTSENFQMKTISMADFEAEKNIQIIDICSQNQYLGWKNKSGNSGHILNAIDFPSLWFSYEPSQANIDIELERRGIDKGKKTIIYSDDDVSIEDYKKFSKSGFDNLYALEKGFNQYVAKGYETERLEGYQRYVSPEWVESLIKGETPENYTNNDFKIVEITLKFEQELYDKEHIEGAVNIKADDLNHILGPRNLADYDVIPLEEQLTFWGLPSDEKIKNTLEESGITKDTTVILYGSEKATTAANRAALVMDYAGVKDIRLLNGGKVLWKLENRPLVSKSSKVEKRSFGAEIPQNPEIIFQYEDELKMIKNPDAVIASVRSWEEYLGKKSGYTYIGEAGDIYGSRFAYAGSNPYAMEDFRNLDNTMFNYNIIANRWKKWGITPDKIVSFHCGTGWRASETYYIAKALGWENIGVYVGGWYQWSKKSDSPVKANGLPTDAPEKQPMEYFH